MRTLRLRCHRKVDNAKKDTYFYVRIDGRRPFDGDSCEERR
jgi:hypothetical protein